MSSERAKLVRDVIDGIGHTTERAMRMNHVAAAAIGVNPTDMQCLQVLAHGPQTAGELARQTGLTTASMTGMIDRLEQAGFVARRRDPDDRRRVIVELQRDRARKDIAPVFLPLLSSWRELLADYDEDTLRLLVDFLRRVEGAIDTEIQDRTPS
jgi:DNA-binding MarR family transcriptional regulator